jgi:hypothetical protein
MAFGKWGKELIEKDFSSAQQLAGSKRGSTGHFSNFPARGGVAVAYAGIQDASHGGADPVHRVFYRVNDFSNQVTGLELLARVGRKDNDPWYRRAKGF